MSNTLARHSRDWGEWLLFWDKKKFTLPLEVIVKSATSDVMVFLLPEGGEDAEKDLRNHDASSLLGLVGHLWGEQIGRHRLGGRFVIYVSYGSWAAPLKFRQPEKNHVPFITWIQWQLGDVDMQNRAEKISQAFNHFAQGVCFQIIFP